LDKQYQNNTIFPPKDLIFEAFRLTSFSNLKVVILGQDPYHGANQAHGLAFSTPKETKNPPSMRNILKEIKQEFCKDSVCQDGYLKPWAKQGVLLLNTILTVKSGEPNSHKDLNWEQFTNNIIKTISLEKKDIIFLLWGANAIKKQILIDEKKHYILTAPHPSPLSAYRGFFGCNHFIKTNNILENLKKDKILW
jgi:uracil-DNA glycosylase